MKLLWTLLVFVIVAPLHVLSQNKCGRQVCVRHATCIGERCVCDKRGYGDFFCSKFDDETCTLFYDSHFFNYNGEKGLFPIPCRHRITNLFLNSTCQIEVFGTSALKQLEQENVVNEVGIEVNIKVGGEIVKIILDSDKETYFYVQEGRNYKITKKRQPLFEVGGIKFTVVFSHMGQHWNILSHQCWFDFKFRPLPKREQPRAPGVPGVLERHKNNTATFPYTTSRFPDTLCSVPGELNAMVDYQQRNNLDSTNLAVIHAWLNSGVGQKNNKQCQCMMDDFGNVCTTKKMKSDAVNICGPMFDDGSRGCFNKDGKIIPYFITCVKAVCSQDSNKLCKFAETVKNIACELPTLPQVCAITFLM